MSPTKPSVKPTQQPTLAANIIQAKVTISCMGGGNGQLANALRGRLAFALPGFNSSLASPFPDLDSISVASPFVEDEMKGYYPQRASPFAPTTWAPNRWPGLWVLRVTLRICGCASCATWTDEHSARLAYTLTPISGASDTEVDVVSTVAENIAPCTVSPAIDVNITLFSTASAEPTPAPTLPRLAHLGEDCWYNCSSKGGPCTWCGWDGLCCRLARPDIGQKWFVAPYRQDRVSVTPASGPRSVSTATLAASLTRLQPSHHFPPLLPSPPPTRAPVYVRTLSTSR
jgi:hypothetical protein